MTNKADQKYWDKYHAGFNLQIAPEIHPIRKLIEEYFPTTDNKTCIEIGCYPGGFLAVFGELGYQLNGIDLSKNTEILPQWLASQNYDVGEFWKEDFLSFNPEHKYDVVSSFGFIEHFTNWEDVLVKHIDLVEENGYIFVEVPNFIGIFQNFLHKYFDRVNYDHHHIPSMDIEKWVKILTDNNFKIIYKEYFGPFYFWVDQQDRNILQRGFLKSLRKISPVLRKILPDNKKAYAPFAGIIAQKDG